jgi:hypothetical protein
MSRTVAAHDPGFGSDSFLDVLANMVGIVIILMVIAGARVGQAPVRVEVAGPPTESETTVVPAAPPEPEPAAVEQTVEAPLLEEPEDDSPPDDVAAEMQQIAAELSAASIREAHLAAELARLEAQAAETRAALSADVRAEIEAKRGLAAGKHTQARLAEALGGRKHELSGLLAEFEEVRNAGPPVTEIRHRLTPVSQEVNGDEVHFRLSNNRVSVIPLAALVERVKLQIERQKDWLARHVRHRGSVGPVDGYSLHYIVERQALSALEERRLGFGAMRVGVSQWQLIPEAGSEGETAEEALRRGSRFAVALQTAPEKAALTFWVYPDSFGLYRTLQAASHAEGFLVSGRPLPDGMPIAGSPHGTRSAGQ